MYTDGPARSPGPAMPYPARAAPGEGRKSQRRWPATARYNLRSQPILWYSRDARARLAVLALRNEGTRQSILVLAIESDDRATLLVNNIFVYICDKTEVPKHFCFDLYDRKGGLLLQKPQGQNCNQNPSEQLT